MRSWLSDFFPLRLRQFPDVVEELFHRDAFFRIGLAIHGDSRLGYGFRAARYQGVPPGEALSLVKQAIGAGFGKPAKFTDIIGGQGHAIGHPGGTVPVVGALAGLEIKQLAGRAGVNEFARILVFQLVEAAAATAVTQAFPFSTAHLREGFGLPEGEIACHAPS